MSSWPEEPRIPHVPPARSENSRPQAAIAFVAGYGQAWEAWDVDRFLGLFSDDIRYVVHPTEETVRGLPNLREYFHKEHHAQGDVSVRMGEPVIGEDHVAAEFWVRSTGPNGQATIAGCLIARLEEQSGLCSEFREYWFELPGHTAAYDGWAA
jgi:ketosteroid isomerase-like protein